MYEPGGTRRAMRVGRGAARNRTIAPALIAALLVTLGLALAAPGAAAAGSCANSWTGASLDGKWATASNWTAGVPTSTQDVCIGDITSGTYTVTLNSSAAVSSLTLGSTIGTQTLVVGNTFGSLSIANPSSVGATGVLNLDLSNGNANSVLSGSTLTNAGTLRVTGVSSSGRPFVRSNVVNNGTLDFQAPETVIDSGVTITNHAAVDVAAAASVVVRDGASFVNQAGTLANGGSFSVRSAGTFTQGGGAVTGNDPVIQGANWNGAGSGAGSFTLLGTSTLSGAIAAGQTVRVDDAAGSGVATIPASYTNAGTLILDMTYNNANTTLQPSTATLTNTGTFRVTGVPSAGRPLVRSNVVNNGTLDFQAPETVIDSGVTITNNAAVDVAASASVVVRDGASFVNQAGTLANAGAFNVRSSSSAGTFTQGDGAVTGNDPVVQGANWNGAGSGAGSFTLLGTSTLSGAIAAGQTVRVDDAAGSGVASIPASYTNAGTLILDMTYDNANTILQSSTPGATLTNTGTFRVTGVPNGGLRSLRVNVVNSGTFVLTRNAVLDFTGSFTQLSSGTTEFDIGSATSFGRMVAGSGGSVAINGTANAVLVGGYSPPLNSTFQVITAPHTGDYSNVTNTFGSDVTNPAFVRLVSGVNPEVAPGITSANATTFTRGTPGSFTVTATGTPNPVVAVSGTLPTGVSFSNGVLSGTPGAGTAGVYPLTVTATNGVSPAASQSFTLTVVNPSVAPAITSANAATFTRGTSGSFTVTATGNPTPVVAVSGTLPAGVSFSGGVLSGAPGAGTAGVYPLTVAATNGVSPAASQSFTLTVVEPSVAPTITSANATSFTVGTSGSFTVTATGSPTPVRSITGTLPSGVSAANGVLSGTPAAGTAGTYPLTVAATNGVSPAASQSFTLTVVQPSVAPTITSANAATFTVGTLGSFTVTATGSPTPVRSITGTLPAGVSFSNGVLSGTPAAGTARTYSLTVRATNGVNPAAAQAFTLTVVNPSVAPTITSANTASFTVGSLGSFTVTATGNPTPVRSITGTLPAGVSFANGVLSGRPAAGTAGTYPLTVRATNGVNPAATQAFTLRVVGAPVAPRITSATSTTFAVGSPGSFTVTATGSPTPVVSLAGTLPPGVTFANGVLSGTPTASGYYFFQITASNGVNPAAWQFFTLQVQEVRLGLTITAPTGVTSTGVTYAFTVRNGVVPSTQPITVTSSYSAGQTYTGFTGNGWSCTDNPAARRVVCTTNQPIASGGTAPVLLISMRFPPCNGRFWDAVNTISGDVTSPGATANLNSFGFLFTTVPACAPFGFFPPG